MNEEKVPRGSNNITCKRAKCDSQYSERICSESLKRLKWHNMVPREMKGQRKKNVPIKSRMEFAGTISKICSISN